MLLKNRYILYVAGVVLLFCASCAQSASSVAKSREEVVRKYSAEQLRKDFDVMRGAMEKLHPSLYWYTPKDSMDLFFDVYRSAIRDSMTQQQFGFSVLAPVTTAIRCGHTSFSFSKKYNQGMRGARLPSFPLFLKIYGDSMVIVGNLNRTDSILKKGTHIYSIDGYNVHDITRIMFRFMPTDGYADNINYIRLSNAFPYYHRNIFGLKKNYTIGYQDSTGTKKLVSIPVYEPAADTLARIRPDKPVKPQKPSHKDKVNDMRSMAFDTTSQTAVMTLNTFDGDYNLNGFFRRSFRLMQEQGSKNLVIDIRGNGGGKVNNYTKLASYIRNTKFKVADSAYAIRKGFGGYGKYISSHFLNSLALGLFTTKHKDGNYHFKYWENHYFHPKKKDFFAGNVYLLISGPTFSASTLFAHTMKGQSNVTLVGEETGGGNYGNNGLMIPGLTLPNTKMKVRMPMFRLIQYQHTAKDGRGVQPDIFVAPSAYGVINGIDMKMKKTMDIIRERQGISVPASN